MIISVVINTDTRQGYLSKENTVGDFGVGSLQGVRSKDLLTDGIRQKIKYFDGYQIQLILFIDVHEPISKELMGEMKEIVFACGNDSKIITKPHSKNRHRWNDWLYIDALKEATGAYVVHFDQDCNAYKKEGSNIVESYFAYLNAGSKYVCQPWDGVGDPMYHASTRFFICKRETLNFADIESSLVTPFRGKHNPCLEFSLGILAGEGTVLYPSRNDDDYIIFSWAKYHVGLIKYLNEKPYDEVINYIRDCGMFGANDVIAKPITNE